MMVWVAERIDLPPLIDRVQQRHKGQIKWLKENYPDICEEQKHLDSGSIERGYWHYGYAMALRDILAKNPIFPDDLPDTSSEL